MADVRACTGQVEVGALTGYRAARLASRACREEPAHSRIAARSDSRSKQVEDTGDRVRGCRTGATAPAKVCAAPPPPEQASNVVAPSATAAAVAAARSRSARRHHLVRVPPSRRPGQRLRPVWLASVPGLALPRPCAARPVQADPQPGPGARPLSAEGERAQHLAVVTRSTRARSCARSPARSCAHFSCDGDQYGHPTDIHINMRQAHDITETHKMSAVPGSPQPAVGRALGARAAKARGDQARARAGRWRERETTRSSSALAITPPHPLPPSQLPPPSSTSNPPTPTLLSPLSQLASDEQRIAHARACSPEPVGHHRRLLLQRAGRAEPGPPRPPAAAAAPPAPAAGLQPASGEWQAEAGEWGGCAEWLVSGEGSCRLGVELMEWSGWLCV